jgi:segregation and condensation protein B
MQHQQLKQAIEALLFAADAALTEGQLLQHCNDSLGADVVSKKQLQQILAELQSDYAERGVQLCKVASGYRFQTRTELGGIISQLWQDKPPRYSQALLETLALVAYRQPITRGDIEAIRGVSVSSQIIKTLQERGWIKVVGHREVPGRPQLYATTAEFLDYFALQDLSQLPDIPGPATASINAETAPKQE